MIVFTDRQAICDRTWPPLWSRPPAPSPSRPWNETQRRAWRRALIASTDAVRNQPMAIV